MGPREAKADTSGTLMGVRLAAGQAVTVAMERVTMETTLPTLLVLAEGNGLMLAAVALGFGSRDVMMGNRQVAVLA